MADEDLKRALSGVFLRDVRGVEPDRRGYLCGDDVRIYVEQAGGYTVRFLAGTAERQRRQLRQRLEASGVPFRVGADFSS